MKIAVILITLLISALCFESCAYQLQTSKSDYLAQQGIHTVYIHPIINRTYKPGVDAIVYNALVKRITALKQITVVRTLEEADAVLTGAVESSEMSGGSGITSNNIQPFDQGSSQVEISSIYNVHLSVSFTMQKRPKNPDEVGVQLWGRSFSRSKNFSTATQTGVAGTTSTLINDTKYTEALADAAEAMMADLHESMLSAF